MVRNYKLFDAVGPMESDLECVPFNRGLIDTTFTLFTGLETLLAWLIWAEVYVFNHICLHICLVGCLFVHTVSLKVLIEYQLWLKGLNTFFTNLETLFAQLIWAEVMCSTIFVCLCLVGYLVVHTVPLKVFIEYQLGLEGWVTVFTNLEWIGVTYSLIFVCLHSNSKSSHWFSITFESVGQSLFTNWNLVRSAMCVHPYLFICLSDCPHSISRGCCWISMTFGRVSHCLSKCRNIVNFLKLDRGYVFVYLSCKWSVCPHSNSKSSHQLSITSVKVGYYLYKFRNLVSSANLDRGYMLNHICFSVNTISLKDLIEYQLCLEGSVTFFTSLETLLVLLIWTEVMSSTWFVCIFVCLSTQYL